MHFENGMSLLFELLPRRANLLLVDSWNSSERTARSIQSFRTISLAPGAIYKLPPLPPTSSEEVRAFSAGQPKGPYAYHRAVAAHFWSGVQETGFSSVKRGWRQAWKTHTKKIDTALKNLRADLSSSQEAELFHRRGLALVNRLFELGAKSFPKTKTIELDGLVIPLDPSKNFADNSEVFFKKSKKMNRAVDELAGRAEALEKKVKDLAIVSQKIEEAETEEDLGKLAPAFETEGVPVPDSNAEEKDMPAAKAFLEVKSTDGFRILCGRNQSENRKVTFQEAKGNDTWLHVKGIPGSHVVIKGMKNKTIPLSTLIEAAQLCLFHSKIRKGKSAEVDYTQRKNVRAIKGTIADVTYTGNKTLYLDADPELLKKLLR
jgi:predicted ribosome quality control (RQC) complex YloA/Tae2 family protein